MAKKRIARATVIAAIAVAITTTASACSMSSSSGSGGSQASGSKGTGQVGYSESFLTDPFQVQLVTQLGVQAKAQSVDLLPAENANDDAGQQTTDVETLIGRGVKGLIVVPVDSKAISPAIEMANNSNIPVVTADLGADQGKIFMIVRANNVLMAQDVCQAMGKKLNGKGTVLNLQGDLSSQNGQDRSNGFTSCMQKNYPGIKVISKPMNWDPTQCGTQAQTVLSTTHVDGLFMASESVCLASVDKVLKNLGKLTTSSTPGHLVTMAIDGTKAGLAAVRAGTLDLDVSQPLNLYAQYGISYIKAAMQGKTFSPGPDGHGGTIVRYGDSLMDLLPPTVVTTANASDPSLWGNA